MAYLFSKRLRAVVRLVQDADSEASLMALDKTLKAGQFFIVVYEGVSYVKISDGLSTFSELAEIDNSGGGT